MTSRHSDRPNSRSHHSSSGRHRAERPESTGNAGISAITTVAMTTTTCSTVLTPSSFQFAASPPTGGGGGPTLVFLAADDDVFLREQFENGDASTLFKFEGIRVMQTTVDGKPESLKLYQPIGWMPQFDIQDLGDDKELYRNNWIIKDNRAEDDFDAIIAMNVGAALAAG